MKKLCHTCTHFDKQILIGHSYDKTEVWQGKCLKQKSNESDGQKPITSLIWACEKFEVIRG